MAQLAISLVVINGEKDLPACLEAIVAQSFRDFELIVVDNASEDASLAIVRRYCPHARIITMQENVGFSKGHNVAIRETNAVYILVLNQDAVLAPDYCEKTLRCMEAHPRVGSLTGKLVSERHKSLTFLEKNLTIDSCGLLIHPSHLVENIGEGRPSAKVSEMREIWGVSGAAAVYRREALSDVAWRDNNQAPFEYFDEDFFMYQEDVDLAYRLQWRGWTSYCLPDALAFHSRTRTGDTRVVSKRGFIPYMTSKVALSLFSTRPQPMINAWSYKNHWCLLIKNVSGGIFLRCAPQLLFFEFAKAVYRLCWERSFVSEIRQVIALLPRMRRKREAILSHRSVSNAHMWSLFS